MVTGAVSSAAPERRNSTMAVKMTQQSAQEVTLTIRLKTFLQDNQPKVGTSRLLGDFPGPLHHPSPTADGLLHCRRTIDRLRPGHQHPIGPSADTGVHDFGITGAPWTKGTRRGEVGGSVIISSHKKKAQKVLMHLRRMYMPLQNYKDLEHEFLDSYWSQGKDILGVTHSGNWCQKSYAWGPHYEKDSSRDLIALRIDYKHFKYQGHQTA
ncbi:MAG: hypothetical protein U5R30_12785 [Deltaproteobacteria bacterium]|nr:hypothetical protein [Deltaproteobacteria bacterium]